MTTVLAVNSDHDIYVDNTNNLAMFFGQSSTAHGLEAVAQACKTTSLAQLREMVLFTTQGMPALQSVFNSNPNFAVYRAALISAMQQVPGVVSVQSITFTKTGSVLNYRAEIQSIYGELTVNG